jgi:chromate reductase
MAVTKTVAVVVGSVRRGSINQALARALVKLAEGRLVFDFLPTGELPLYNGDPNTTGRSAP